MDYSKEILVIGSSGNIAKKENGKLIDSFGTVVRINKIITDPINIFGTKTTHWWRCMRPAIDADEEYVKQIELMVCLDFRREPISQQHILPKKFRYIDSDLWNYAITEMQLDKGKWARTGMLAILHYLQNYSQIYITGFDIEEDSDYFDGKPNTKKIAWMHQFDKEKQYLKKLINDKKIIEL